ncbi:Pentatricopeptide repeat-containing protein [Arachis hypogaea]|nr:Pentatricopeptide repeat-containing protein [Arachis hypogaea]
MAQHDDLSAPPRPLPPSPSPTKTDPRTIHARAIKSVATDNATFNNLVTLYSKLESLASYFVRVFSQIRSPNVVSWTALVSSHSNTLLALRYFVSMLRHPTLPNNRTLASLFRTSAALSALPFALSLHSLSLKLALSSDPFAGSALLSFYFKCRMPHHAHKVFDEIPDRDSVCYSAMIVGLAQNSRSVDALLVLADMRHRGFASTKHSVSGGLRAAAELAALEQRRMIHGHAVVAGFDSNVVVGSALVDGYGKAGVVENARQQGDHKSTSELFDSMECQGLVPDEYSFLAMLTALYNAGMFLEADQWLTRMKVDYGLQPTLVHYTCLVCAMARAGHLKQAERVALTMPYEPDAAVWRALLSACAFHGEADKAWSMARRVLELEPLDDSAYVIVANVLSAAGRWDDVAELRKMLRDRRVKKQGGRSWVEIQGKVHVFAAGDWKHERSAEIYRKLQEIMEEIEKLGYVPIWDELLHNVEEERRKEALWHHSEKLAVAFGVLCGSAPPGKPLRIVKNLKICKDCHEAFKYMTRILERKIIGRDVNRYHRFVDVITHDQASTSLFSGVSFEPLSPSSSLTPFLSPVSHFSLGLAVTVSDSSSSRCVLTVSSSVAAVLRSLRRRQNQTELASGPSGGGRCRLLASAVSSVGQLPSFAVSWSVAGAEVHNSGDYHAKGKYARIREHGGRTCVAEEEWGKEDEGEVERDAAAQRPATTKGEASEDEAAVLRSRRWRWHPEDHGDAGSLGMLQKGLG